MAINSTRAYSLLLGARNTPGTGGDFSAEDDARIREITARHFPEGFTILRAKGGWFDPAQKAFIEEASREIRIVTSRPALLRPWCDELGAALGQQELLVVELGAAAMFRVGR
jgi:hypothetical protein